MLKCNICGMTFTREKELEEHSIVMHNFAEEETSLLVKTSKEEKARRRSRGPYRKAHAA
jgi:uncharacterized C2H2 Zn-finger protein